MVRRYLPEAVPDEVLRRIVETGRRGPSAGFTQGQSFVVVTDPGLRREIAGLAGEGAYASRGFEPWISEAPAHVAVCTSGHDYRHPHPAPDHLRPPGQPTPPLPLPFH